MERVQVLSIIVSLVILFSVVELVRSRKLKENYSVLWICASVVILFFATFRHLIDQLGLLVGVYYTPSAFFLLAILFLILIMVQFSVTISKLSDRNKDLSQEVAILTRRLEELEGKDGQASEQVTNPVV